MNLHEVGTNAFISILKVRKSNNLETDPTLHSWKCQRQGLKPRILIIVPLQVTTQGLWLVGYIGVKCDCREAREAPSTLPLTQIPSTETKAAGTLDLYFSFIFLIQLAPITYNTYPIVTRKVTTTLYKFNCSSLQSLYPCG